MIELGVSEEDAEFYAEGVKREGVLIAVQAEGGYASMAKNIMKQAAAVNVESRRQAWLESGWVGFDESESPDSDYPKVWIRPGS